MTKQTRDKEKKPKRPSVVSPKLREQLALCASYPEDVLFLDIETTGLSHYYDEITIVGWALGGKVATFVKGEDHGQLLDDAAGAKALVTFNGIRFDQRFLLQEFPEIILPKAHVDLMYLCRRVGLTGGQKSIENQLGLNFREDLADVDGLAAVLLWHRYLRGDIDALDKLIRYNRADIAAMGAIFDKAQALLILEPDFFSKAVKFEDWSAPEGWQIPPPDLMPAASDLTNIPHFDELFENTAAANARVVGIDLTGSEARASGWCLLEGTEVKTEMISTDDEIIEHTLSANPDIVSIDSPLCLPAGRITVDDTDPGRDLYGIMRQCERELKRRGVNVYPSLLPSMQKLTARGIRLAQIFRDKGLPAIESYPGAAQDIMRIPRKGAGIEWLKQGLIEFGISGEIEAEKVTHDELDAVTSALVGTFHLAGLSEAMGTKEEPPLIVPDLGGKPGPIVIGIGGPIAAGKTTFAQMLEEKGFAYTRFSLVIDEKLKERNMMRNRANRQKVGAEINEVGGQRLLAALTIERVIDAERIVVDGLRFPEDHAFFVEQFGARFRHIYVDADEEVRRSRYEWRENDGDFSHAANSSVEKRVCELGLLANERFVNNSGKQEMTSRVDELVGLIDGKKLCLFLS